MANQVQNPEARALLEAAGLTPAELRTLTGVGAQTMSRWWAVGIPKYAQTIIAAWPMLGASEKSRLLADARGLGKIPAAG